MVNKKIQHGQYFTRANPFILVPFKKWFSFLPQNPKLLEPFSGSNNLVKMIYEIFGDIKWESFDIDPPKENFFPDVTIKRRDTILNMPNGFGAIITNPPYLAKNSSTRKGLSWHRDNKYDDLYKFCLEKMLENYDFVAAIIPESFIVSGLFHSKLFGVISLTQNMFTDTDCPVCIAMFVSKKIKNQENLRVNDFKIWQMDKFLGTYNELLNVYNTKLAIDDDRKMKFVFNDKNGILGLRGVDNTNTNSIRFVLGSEINPDDIKTTSRAITRIGVSLKLNKKETEKIIARSNDLLKEYREETQDVFMTAFKGLRKDGKYRRRLDFETAEKILNQAMYDLKIHKIDGTQQSLFNNFFYQLGV